MSGIFYRARDYRIDKEGADDGQGVRRAVNSFNEGNERQDLSVQKLILALEICYVVAGLVERVLRVAQFLQ